MSRSRRGAVAAATVATALSAAWLPPVAAGADDAPAASLSPGSWTGVASAAGTATATEQGVTFVLRVDIDADLAFQVARNGTVTGDWNFEAPVRMDGEGLAEGRSFAMRWRGPVRGTGTVTGSPTHLTMVGTQTSGGVVTVDVDGHSFTTAVSEQNPSPPLKVQVEESTCDEVFGDWVYALEAAFTEEGWSPQVDGLWFAWRDTDADSKPLDERGELGEVYGDLVKDVNQLGVDEGWLEPIEGEAPANPFTDIRPRIFDLTNRIVAFHNEVRNLSDCESLRFSEDEVERFFTMGAALMGNLIVAANVYDFSVATIRVLMDAALQVGTVGAGAIHPRAEALEGLLHDHAADILDDWLDDGVSEPRDGTPRPDAGCRPAAPCIITSPEAIDVLVTSAAYGWSFQIGDNERTAAELVTRVVDAGEST